jgi:hypothetical protein
MTLFDAPAQRPPWKYRRPFLTIAAAIVIAAVAIVVLLRFHTERTTIRRFMNALVTENYQQAYQIWKPAPSYSLPDFLQDWGPAGYYGPVKSYRIDNHQTEKVKGGESVAITVEVSPFQPFPDESDPVKHNQTKSVVLWVKFSDESLSFPPD